MKNRHLVTGLGLMLMALGGCMTPAPELPPDPTLPEVQAVEVGMAEPSDGPDLRSAVVRVGNLSCYGVSTGSGFFLEDDLVVTNRHVVAGADTLWISTWDGRRIDATIHGVSFDADLAVVKLAEPVDDATILDHSTELSDELLLVGYPLGGTYSETRATPVDRVPGWNFDQNADLFRIEGEIEYGISGGPVVTGDGDVAGVVFAVENITDLGLVIDIDELDTRLDLNGLSSWDTTCADFVTD